MSLRGGDGITHLHYTGTPLWQFGFGLSYSSFEVTVEAEPQPTDAVSGWTVGSFAVAAAAKHAVYSVRVTNVGSVGGGFNVPGFVTSDQAEGFPLQRLFGFVGVDWLEPGASRVLELALPTAKQLSVADEHGQQWLQAADYTVHIGAPPGGSDDPTAASAAVSVLQIRGDAPLAVSRPL